MTRHMRRLPGFLVIIVALIVATTGPQAWAADPFEEARIFFEYNSTDNDLGVHVSLDAEDWRTRSRSSTRTGRPSSRSRPRGLQEVRPDRDVLRGRGAVARRGPARGTPGPVPGGEIQVHRHDSGRNPAAEHGEALLRHSCRARRPSQGWRRRGHHQVGGRHRSAGRVSGQAIKIVGYQVIVGSFQVTLPASSRSVEVPEEYIKSP